MNFTPTECRAIERVSAETLNLLIAQLNIFNDCRRQLDNVQDAICGDCTHNASPANDASRLVDKAIENIDKALALVVEVRLREINAPL